MSYNSNVVVKNAYVDDWIVKYMLAHKQFLGEMRGVGFVEESSVVASVNTAMIAFTKAAGMDIPSVGIAASFDESLKGVTVDFKTVKETVNPPAQQAQGGYQSGGYKSAPTTAQTYSAPAQQSGDGPKKISAAQLGLIQKYAAGKFGEPTMAYVQETLAKANVNPEDLTSGEAYKIIAKCKEINPGN